MIRSRINLKAYFNESWSRSLREAEAPRLGKYPLKPPELLAHLYLGSEQTCSGSCLCRSDGSKHSSMHKSKNIISISVTDFKQFQSASFHQRHEHTVFFQFGLTSNVWHISITLILLLNATHWRRQHAEARLLKLDYLNWDLCIVVVRPRPILGTASSFPWFILQLVAHWSVLMLESFSISVGSEIICYTELWLKMLTNVSLLVREGAGHQCAYKAVI